MRLECIYFFSIVYEQFRSILDFFGQFICRSSLLVWIISKLVIQKIVWNSSMEYSCWFPANACMITCIMSQNCKRQLFMPLSKIFLTCYFEIRLEENMCSLQLPDCLWMLGRCTFECNSQTLCNFRNNRGCERSSFICNERCWFVSMFSHDVNDNFCYIYC